MPKSLNKVQLIGMLGRDPELKTTTRGKNYSHLSLATTDGTGDYKKTNWHQITLWGKNAEAAATYLKKGATIYVEGILSYNEYTKDGVKRRDAEVTGFQVIYLGSKNEPPPSKPADEEPPW